MQNSIGVAKRIVGGDPDDEGSSGRDVRLAYGYRRPLSDHPAPCPVPGSRGIPPRYGSGSRPIRRLPYPALRHIQATDGIIPEGLRIQKWSVDLAG